MKAPEKIYLLKTSFKILDGWYDSKIPVPKNFEQLEYTRTDAFIEKACEWLEPIIFSMNLGDRPDTDKFIEDFKNYMKGE